MAMSKARKDDFVIVGSGSGALTAAITAQDAGLDTALYEKAAKVDGATPFQAFTKVSAPLAAPGMVTTAILVFLFCWNDFIFAISFTSTISSRTAPAAMQYFSGGSVFTVPTGPIAAADGAPRFLDEVLPVDRIPRISEPERLRGRNGTAGGIWMLGS